MNAVRTEALMPYCGEESTPTYEQADDQIARELALTGDDGELVQEVRNAAGLLDWIAHNVELPPYLLMEFRLLDRRARAISRRAGELVGADA